jgi:hypothetical protein
VLSDAKGMMRTRMKFANVKHHVGMYNDINRPSG